MDKFREIQPPVSCVLLLLLLVISSCKFFSGANKDHPQLMKQMISQSKSLIRVSPKKAIASLDSTFHLVKNPGVGDLYTCLQFKRMMYADTIGKLDVALTYADSILALIKPLSKMPPYKLNYAEELLAKGDILFRLHLFNEAYAAYFDGRSVMENAADACDKSRFFSHFYRRLADISYGKGAFEESAAWQKKALTDLSACVNTGDETYLTQGTLDNIGLSYLLAGKPDSALFYFNSALKLISEMKITGKYPLHDLEVAEGVILGNRGTLFFKTGKLESAEQDFVRSIGINERKGYANEDALITRTKLGELYLKSVQISKAGE